MPYTADGMVPDIIVNPHSIPTRMAVNQLTECKLGIVAALLGHHIDATAMNEPDDAEADRVLEAHGIRCKGYKRLWNGRTGMWIDALIFMGPTTYQRLQKFVEDDNYAIMNGPVNPVTHQAVEGRTNAGGLRLGEMEKDTIVAHGSQHLLHEKFYKHSSGHTIHICRLCGERATVNEKYGIYKCRICGDSAEIVAVPSDWCSNLFFNENSAMNVKATFSVEPHTYEQ
jgi:DNA-directed RNA polymerase II subunit RPB2